MLQEPILRDATDTFAKSVVDRSNRIFELRQMLGTEITSAIERADGEFTPDLWPVGTAGTALVGAVTAVGIQSRHQMTRRSFLDSLVIGLSAGAAAGFFGVSPAIAVGQYHRFKSYVENQLIPRYNDKAPQIREYMALQYPSHSI